MSLHSLRQFISFYRQAITKYQLHSPFVFDLAHAVLDDNRWYYAFRDVEYLRGLMRASDTPIVLTDYGTGAGNAPMLEKQTTVGRIARRAASSRRQGQRLFRLVSWAAPKTVLELGTSLGIGTMYLASAARQAQVRTLEGCADCAAVARTNLEQMQLIRTEVIVGPFAETLQPTLQQLQQLDFVFIDGNHREKPTLTYFETCLPFAHPNTVFVFDDIYGSAGMTTAWQKVQQHPKVTLTVDFFDLSLAFINPDFREKQHLCVVPAAWKPWKFL